MPLAPSPSRTTPAQAARGVRELLLALIEAIAGRLERSPLTQGELAATLAITRLRLNRLLKHDVEHFCLDSLAAIAARAGLVVRVAVTRPYRHR